MKNIQADLDGYLSSFKPPAMSCLDYMRIRGVGEVAASSRRTDCEVTFMTFSDYGEH
jgi:hypothetical protein